MQIPMPIDTHTHLRTGEMLEAVVPLVARCCQAAVVMPNTAQILTGADAARHRDEIKSIATRAGFTNFRPLMAVMLKNDTDPRDVVTWPDAGVVVGKMYPADLYLHGGVSDLHKIDDVLREMGRVGIPLSGHFEKAKVAPLFAEQAAIPDFRRIADRGDVQVVFEHVSTVEALEAVRDYPHTHAVATITPMHLRMTADDVFDRSRTVIRRPHNWCRPVAKTPEDRQALIDATTSGSSRFFLGTDFAPHHARLKANTPPPAGCACYPATLPVLAEIFASQGCLGQLSDFTSGRAAEFYGIRLSGNAPPLTIVEEDWTVPMSILFGPHDEFIVPWLAGETLHYRVVF